MISIGRQIRKQIVALFLCGATVACTGPGRSVGTEDPSDQANVSRNASVVDSTEDIVSSNQNESEVKIGARAVRSIDFANFTYDWFPKYDSIVIKKNIVLHNGENPEKYVTGPGIRPNGDYYTEQLLNVSYKDLTGDGKEEAVVTVGVTFFRWTPVCMFIFGEENKHAVFLWKYAVDARQYELRGIKTDGRNLIIEAYDNNFDDAATCCPKRYIRRTFTWNGRSFQEKNTETVPYGKDSREFTGLPSDN